MSVQSDLFDLIRSMTRTEKRYFKRYASLHARGGCNFYVRLFDLIDACGEYDESEVRAQYEQEGATTHFSEAKRYLYTVLLKALHQFHLDSSVESRIQMLLHQADILYNRKLYRQFMRTAEKAKELALQYELSGYVVEALGLQYRMLLLEHNDPDVAARVDALFGEMVRHNDIGTNCLEYRRLHAKMYFLMKSSPGPRSGEEMRRYLDIMEHPHMRSEDGALSPSARAYYYLNHAIYRDALGDYTGALLYHKKVLETVCNSRRWMKPETHAYIPALYNICLVAVKARNLDDFRQYYPQLVESAARQPGDEGYRLHVQALTLLPHLYITMGEFEKAVAAIDDTEHAVQQFGGRLRIGLESYIWFLGFYACFGTGNYRRSLDYLNRILDKREGEVDKTLLYSTRLVFLIVHAELQHYDLLEYLLKSTYRFLLSRKRVLSFEKLILAFIRRLIAGISKAAVPALFRRLRTDLVQLQQDPYEARVFEYFDYPAWVESKVERVPFADVVRKNFRASQKAAQMQKDCRETDDPVALHGGDSCNRIHL